MCLHFAGEVLILCVCFQKDCENRNNYEQFLNLPLYASLSRSLFLHVPSFLLEVAVVAFLLDLTIHVQLDDVYVGHTALAPVILHKQITH